MKRMLAATIAILVAGAVPVMAGGAECAEAAAAKEAHAHKVAGKCEYDTQACLDMMAKHFENRGWVGVELDDETPGRLTITQVEPDSPAKAAGLRRGDVLVAMNGIQFSEENQEAMKAAQQKMTVGATITYTVVREGKSQDIDVTLAKIPDAVVSKWIGRHMLEHASVELAQAQE